MAKFNYLVPISGHAALLYASLIVLALTGCKKDCTPDATETDIISEEQNGQLIPGQFIVVLKEDGLSPLAFRGAATYEQRTAIMRTEAERIMSGNLLSEVAIERTFSKAIYGFVVKLSNQQADKLKQDSRVAYLEPDRIIALGKPGGGGTTQPAQTVPYGVTRVGSSDGTGKVAWIIDSGVDLDHPDLTVDVSRSKSFITIGKNASSPDDGNGHGTHVAGTIAAINNTIGVVGVAAGATVVAVRVLDSRGSGTISGVIQGVDYVAATAAAGDVANMSLGGGVSTSLDNAVISAASNGILFSLAAGNESDNANNHSPARANGANIYTVSAMNSSDNWAGFSNYGNPPIDYCAPGVNIYSTWKAGQYNTISGTSMAAPHVAGILLLRGGAPITDGYVTNDPDGNPDPIAHY